jgi:hypothetical protein
MIRLEIRDYCADCPDFEPDVEKSQALECGDEIIRSDTVIRCRYRKRCTRIKRYLEERPYAKS